MEYKNLKTAKIVLVTGASGFVGKSLCLYLSNIGFNLKTISRSPSPPIPQTQHHQITDICDPSINWGKLLYQVDFVIHLAAHVHKMSPNENDAALFHQINTVSSENIYKACSDCGVQNFIFISTIGVHGSKSTTPFSEDSILNPQNLYAKSKLEGEIRIKDLSSDSDCKFVIIRPPLIYGKNAPGNFQKINNLLSKMIPLPLGSINNKRNFLYIKNLCSFIHQCLIHKNSENETFVIADSETVSTSIFLKTITSAKKNSSFIFPFPLFILKFFCLLIGKLEKLNKLTDDLIVQNKKATSLLNWTPPYTTFEAIGEIYQLDNSAK